MPRDNRFIVQDAGKPKVSLPGPGRGKGTAKRTRRRKAVVPAGKVDGRKVRYAARRSIKMLAKRVWGSVTVAWGTYQWLEAQGFVPPIRTVVFGVPPMWWSLIAAIVSVSLVVFVVYLLDERSREQVRK